MRIAVVNETSTADRNADILAALEGRDHEVVNVGMRKGGAAPELTVIHTGFLSALLLASGRADYVVGGCGTGQGYELSVSQYPNVSSGHVQTPMDAWLFTRINGGNCVSLALNQGYGWAGEVNLGMIFDQLFGDAWGAGYPAHRRSTQQESRQLLEQITAVCHRSMAQIVGELPERVVVPALTYPGVWKLLDVDTLEDRMLAEALRKRHDDSAGHDDGDRQPPDD